MIRVALVGMMGVGKSEVGRKAADMLGLKYIDVDTEFEKKYGPIEKFFFKKGEKEFRKKESELLVTLSKCDDILISTGGGVVENVKNIKVLEKLTTFYLYVSPKILWERVKGTSRPLIKDEESFIALFNERKEKYEHFRKINIEGLKPWEAAARVAKGVFTSFKEIEEEFSIFQNVKLSTNFLFPKADLTIVSKDVKKIWKIEGTAVKDGEHLKRVKGIKLLWDTFLKTGIDKGSTVNFVGGGTVTDSGGFAAQTFKRGIKFRFVPTTLLGMVDASIGGKTAINFRGIKNVVGVFTRPSVFINPLFSLSLEEKIFKEGIVEALKVGVVYDRALFEYVEEKLSSLLARNIEDVVKLVVMSVNDKLKIVEKDPYDMNFRHILNFGHSVGHAIESASGNTISHGHAVAIGMMKESRCFSPKIAPRIQSIIQKLSFEDIILPPRVEEWISKDKKCQGEKMSIPVVEEIGKSRVVTMDINAVQCAVSS